MSYDLENYLDENYLDDMAEFEPDECWYCGKPIPIVRPDDDHCSERCKRLTAGAADDAAEAMYG